MSTKHGSVGWLPVSLIMLSIGCARTDRTTTEVAGGVATGVGATRYVDVYISLDPGVAGCVLTDEGGHAFATEEIFVLPGDVIRWINRLNTDENLQPAPNQNPFELSSYVLKSNSITETKVRVDATAGNYGGGLECKQGAVTGPTIVVGNPP